MNKLPKCAVTINLIVGIDLNNAIGYNNDVLFDCPEDTNYYKEKTDSTIVIMGRGTFESLGNKVLPNRLNIVISSSLSLNNYPQYTIDELLIFPDSVSVIDYLNTNLPTRDIFVIGGESIYKWFMVHDYVDYIYLNTINKKANKADRFFPSYLYATYKEIYSKKHLWSVDGIETTVLEQKLSRI